MRARSKALISAASRRAYHAASVLPIEADERYQPEADACIERNRDVLNESIERSRDELSAGIFSTRTIDNIIARGRKRRANQSRG